MSLKNFGVPRNHFMVLIAFDDVETKKLVPQSQQVAKEGTCLLKKDMEAQSLRHKLQVDALNEQVWKKMPGLQ